MNMFQMTNHGVLLDRLGANLADGGTKMKEATFKKIGDVLRELVIITLIVLAWMHLYQIRRLENRVKAIEAQQAADAKADADAKAAFLKALVKANK